MSLFTCSLCEYTSTRKDFLIKHINRKIKCTNEGIPELIQIPIKIKCQFCNKYFKSSKTLERHLKNSCKLKTNEMESLLKINADLEKKLAIALENKEPESKSIINNTINNNIQINLILNGYSETSIEKLNDKHFLRALSKMILSVPTMIKDVHFNPKIPENQNIYISNLRNGYVMVFNNETKNWEARPKAEMIDKIINDREYDIQEWLGEGERYPKAMEKFNEYLEKKEMDDVQKIIKDEIELVLYNNRKMIKK